MSTLTNKSGFTIVELLIVIVVIGILAAITIVAFNGIQNRGYDATIQADLNAFKKKIDMQLIDSTSGQYPNTASVTDGLASFKLKLGTSAYAVSPTTSINVLYCMTPDRLSYALLSLSKSGKKLYVTNTSGVSEYTGTDTWTDNTSYPARCRTVLANSNNYATAGYSSGDPVQWRPWTRGE